MNNELVNASSQHRLYCVRTLRRLLVTLSLVGGIGLSGSLFAGDPAAGQEKSATCAACHGANGVSEIPTNPVLAGQYASYIEYALKSYRDGSRQNAIMNGFAAQLSDQDIADLAAYYSSQSGPLKTSPRP